MPKAFVWSTVCAVAALLGLFFFWPIATVLAGAFRDADGHFTGAYAGEIFRNRIYLEGLLNSLLLATGTTALTALLALPLAWLTGRFAFPGRRLLTSLLLAPMILPPFVGAIGIRQVLGQYGALNAFLAHLHLVSLDRPIDWLGTHRLWGIVVINALHLYPLLYLNLAAAWSSIDPALEEAGENLGSSGWRRFRRITLPLLRPGFFAGGTLVFIFAFTELGVPLIFDFARVTPVQIFYGAKEIAGNPFPFALVTILLGSTALLYALGKAVLGRAPGLASSRIAREREVVATQGARRWLCTSALGSVVFLALLPHLAVVLTSVGHDWYQTVLPQAWTLDHYQEALGHELAVPSIVNSLKYASLSAVLDLVLGFAIAAVIVRSEARGRWLLDATIMLPLAVPGLVLAFGYLAITREGQFLAPLNPARDPSLLLVLAYAVRRLPYVVRSAVAGLQQTSVTLEEAAQNLGAPPLRTWWRITTPLVSSHLLAGGLLAFSFAMLEVSDSLLLAQKQQHFPITKAIYELFLLLGEGRYVACALGVWAMTFLALSLVAVHRLLGSRFGSVFRA